MKALPASNSWSLEQLLEAVARLSPSHQREFQRRLTTLHAAIGSPEPDQASLVQAAQARLPPPAERRLRRLIARSERGRLVPQELADYQTLAEEAQRIDAAQAEALATLARRPMDRITQ